MKRKELELYSLLLNQLAISSKMLSEQLEQDYSKIGLKKSSFEVLSALSKAKPSNSMTPNQILSKTTITSGALTTRINKLESRGWVIRTKSESDKRSKLVTLTPQGKEVIKKASLKHNKLIKSLFSNLDKTEKVSLSHLLAKLYPESLKLDRN